MFKIEKSDFEIALFFVIAFTVVVFGVMIPVQLYEVHVLLPWIYIAALVKLAVNIFRDEGRKGLINEIEQDF